MQGRTMGAVLAALTIAIAAGAPAANAQSCGGLLQPACPEAPPPATPSPVPEPEPSPTPRPKPKPKPEPKPSKLTGAQFRALDAILTASIANDKPRRTPKAAARYASRCRALDRSDPVLRAYRPVCAGLAKRLVLANGRCTSPPACRRAFSSQARALLRVARSARELNAALGRHVANERCRAALVVAAAERRALGRIARTMLRAVAVARRGASAEQIDRVLAPNAEAFRAVPSPQKRRAGLRRSCR